MHAAKKKFKSTFRKCKRSSKQKKADALALAFISDKSGKRLWVSIKMFKASALNTLPLTIKNVSGEQPIADMWENKYRRLLNSTDESLSDLVHFHLSNESNHNDLRKYFTNADIVMLM